MSELIILFCMVAIYVIGLIQGTNSAIRSHSSAPCSVRGVTTNNFVVAHDKLSRKQIERQIAMQAKRAMARVGNA